MILQRIELENYGPYKGVISLDFLILLLLQTRAALLALVIGIVFYAIILFKTYTKQRLTNKLLWPVLLLLSMLLFSGSIYLFRDKFSVITRTESFKERAALWQNSWEMFKEYPMGVGAGNWPRARPFRRGFSMAFAHWAEHQRR